MTASSNARLPMAWRRRWPGARRQRVAGGVAGRHHGGKHRVGLYRHGRRQGRSAHNLSVLALEKTQFKNPEAVTASVRHRQWQGGRAGRAGREGRHQCAGGNRPDPGQRGRGRDRRGGGRGHRGEHLRDTTTASVSEAQVSAPSVSVDALVAVDFSRTQTAGVAADGPGRERQQGEGGYRRDHAGRGAQRRRAQRRGRDHGVRPHARPGQRQRARRVLWQGLFRRSPAA